jgi:hypothetical protein
MVNLQAKGRKDAERTASAESAELKANGYTVFHFDFRPQQTFRNLSLGDAFRKLKKLTGYKVTFWRCPVRGLAVKIHFPPATTLVHDKGETWSLLAFSTKENEAEAKRDLVLELLLSGMNQYRALPNTVFDEQVAIVKALLMAPPSMDGQEWLAHKARLHPKIAPLVDTHQAELRHHLLGEQYRGPIGPVAVSMTPPISPPSGTG